jgi:hypothetical protein
MSTLYQYDSFRIPSDGIFPSQPLTNHTLMPGVMVQYFPLVEQLHDSNDHRFLGASGVTEASVNKRNRFKSRGSSMDYMSEIFDMIANANTTLSQTQFSDMLTNALLDTAVKGNMEETMKHQHQEGQGLPPPTMLLLCLNT